MRWYIWCLYLLWFHMYTCYVRLLADRRQIGQRSLFCHSEILSSALNPEHSASRLPHRHGALSKPLVAGEASFWPSAPVAPVAALLEDIKYRGRAARL